MATDVISTDAISRTSTAKIYKNLVDGEWVEASTGQTFENLNPADTRDVVGVFQKSGKADVDAAVDAAKRAFAKWRLVPAPRRTPLRCPPPPHDAQPILLLRPVLRFVQRLLGNPRLHSSSH